jgi:hypothetical protein
MWKLRTEEKQEMGKKHRKHWQRALAKTPKKAYTQIFRKAAATTSAHGSVHDTSHTNMSTVRDPVTGIRTRDPVAVLDNVTTYFNHQQADIGGNKHGEYGDRADLWNYPFSKPGATDSFVLEPHPGIDRNNMSKAMTEEMLCGDLFRTTLARSSNHARPGRYPK